MKVEKLPSGSYRVRKMYKGQNYTLTFNYKPTQKEVLQALSEKMENGPEKVEHLTFTNAAKKYIDMKRNVLSPSTINAYDSILRNLSDKFCSMLISDITAIDIQKEINDYSVDRSSKTVRNAHGFISTVLGMFRPGLNLSTTLPQKTKTDSYMPTDDDVKRILQRAKGTKFEIPLLLATFGLRRSEICALTLDDLNGNLLTINKALVTDGEKLVVKTTKTTEGTRTIYLPDYLADLIRERGEIFNGYPNQIYKNLVKFQKELDIPHFKLHTLRHYYASMSHSLGIPDSYIMQAGGWKSDNTLKTVYRHAMKDKSEEMQEFAAQYISELIEK